LINALNAVLGLKKEGKFVFDIILRKGPLTKGEILDITKMKLSTLNRIMQPLENERLIVESSIGESTGGRRPILYDVNPHQFYLIGVDISRTYTQMVVTNLKTNILYQKQFPMNESSTPQKIVYAISEFIDDASQKLSISKYSIIGIGIGTVGPLDRIKGKMFNPRSFLATGWNNVHLKDMVEDITKLPVTIDNGANAAALAEYIYGVGKGLNNIVYINCGVGIRTGAISSGMIVRTLNDAEDAFGHMVIDVDGDLCCCGNYGCIECYSSIPSIVKKFSSELKKGRITDIRGVPEDINYIDICRAAESGDQLAKEVIISAGTILGVGLANYINLLNPELTILSGPLIKHSKLLFDTCKGVALNKCYLKGENMIQFSRGGFFQEKAIAVGAAALMIEQVLSA
jgi:predicted NBD/HSP70 family sugar kinase